MYAPLHGFVQRLKHGESVVIAGLGDSLTEGWMVSSGFFDRFVAMLAQKYPEARISGITAGVPGDTAAGGLSRIDCVLVRRPDLVTVQFGINDMYMGESVGVFDESIRAMVGRFQSSGSIPVLTTSCPMKSEKDREGIAPFYHAILTAGEDLGAPVADTALYWASHMACWEGLLQPDGVHPTDEGHRLMALGLAALF